MALAAGDINRASGFLIIDAKSKTNAATTKGRVHKFETDGWRLATTSDTQGGWGVALDTNAAGGAGVQTDVRILVWGVIGIDSTAAAITQGGLVKVGDAAGKVVAYTVTAGDSELVVGMALTGVGGSGGVAEVFVGKVS